MSGQRRVVLSHPDRRSFVKSSVSAAVSTFAVHKSAHAADKKVVGLMGCGGRGTQLIRAYAKRPEIEVKYICDVDQSRFPRTAAAVENVTGEIPKRVTYQSPFRSSICCGLRFSFH